MYDWRMSNDTSDIKERQTSHLCHLGRKRDYRKHIISLFIIEWYIAISVISFTVDEKINSPDLLSIESSVSPFFY